MMTAIDIIQYMESLHDEEQRQILMRFFKTGPGEYGEGDEFIGLKVPQDISIAGYDGGRISEIVEPALTTLWQDTTSIGRLAAERLINLIESPKTTLIERVMVPGKLIEGGSVARI